MLFAARRLGEHLLNARAGQWTGLIHSELHGRTLGIIGLGPIGLGAAERALAFGMNVIGCRRTGEPIECVREVVPPDRLDELLGRSDFVALACPLTEQTRGLIGRAELHAMKRTAWLINIARGAIVQTDELVAALQNGVIAGACLDVTDPEPPPAGHPLWTLPNVLLTPHNASGDSPDLRRRKVEYFVENLRRYLADQPLMGLVKPQQGY
jgi:phosphoglycerate dehydrogenase-like enzyme